MPTIGAGALDALTGTAGTTMIGSVGFIAAEPLHFAVLIFSAVLWLVSLFILGESVRILRWIFVDDPGAPNPRAGMFLFPALSVLIVISWFAYRLFFFSMRPDLACSSLASWYRAPMLYPLEFVPGFVIASIPLVIVGSMKLLTILVAFTRQTPAGKKASRKPFLIALLYLFLQVMGSTASAVSLYRAFFAK